METSEFIAAMEKLGLDHYENYFDVLIYKNSKEILRVNKQFIFFMKNNNSEFNNLSEKQKKKIMKFVWDYISTPIEERGN